MEATSEGETVIYISSLNYLSDESINEIINYIRNNKVFIVEENSIIGGLGDYIFNISSENNVTINATKIAIPNKFLTNYGKPEQHREMLGLTTEKIKTMLREK